MTKEDLVKEFDRLIEAYYSEEIDSRDEWLREIIWLKDEVVNKLTIPVVVGQSEQLCNICQEPKLEQDDDLCIECWQKYRNL